MEMNWLHYLTKMSSNKVYVLCNRTLLIEPKWASEDLVGEEVAEWAWVKVILVWEEE